MLRVTPAERAVAEHLAQRLSTREGVTYNLADVLRAGLGLLAEREYGSMSEAERAKAPPMDED